MPKRRPSPKTSGVIQKKNELFFNVGEVEEKDVLLNNDLP